MMSANKPSFLKRSAVAVSLALGLALSGCSAMSTPEPAQTQDSDREGVKKLSTGLVETPSFSFESHTELFSAGEKPSPDGTYYTWASSMEPQTTGEGLVIIAFTVKTEEDTAEKALDKFIEKDATKSGAAKEDIVFPEYEEHSIEGADDSVEMLPPNDQAVADPEKHLNKSYAALKGDQLTMFAVSGDKTTWDESKSEEMIESLQVK